MLYNFFCMLIAKNQESANAPGLNAFSFENQKVRSLLVNDRPWFVAKDVCRVLGHSNSRKAISNLKDFEKGVTNSYTLGGNQKVSIVNESGLYKLIFRSRKPFADNFTQWVTEEVLPSIRKFGCYIPLKVNTDGDFAGLMPIQVGGRQLLCYTDVLRKIGRSTKSGSVQARRKRYSNHFFKLFNRNFITIELAQQLLQQKSLDSSRQALQLQLPFNQGGASC